MKYNTLHTKICDSCALLLYFFGFLKRKRKKEVDGHTFLQEITGIVLYSIGSVIQCACSGAPHVGAMIGFVLYINAF